MADDSIWFWPVFGCIGIVAWVLSEYWVEIKGWWNTEIVADYPYEDDL